MREILFRGQEYDNGPWYEGDYEHTTLSDGSPFAFISGWGKFGKIVKPETVGQYTGLTDKNGTRIFEGDIVRIIEKGAAANGVVKFVNKYAGGWIVGSNIDDAAGCVLVMRPNVEVIGNIHDNPELLQGDNNED